jgi:hypothetical protein
VAPSVLTFVGNNIGDPSCCRTGVGTAISELISKGQFWIYKPTWPLD